MIVYGHVSQTHTLTAHEWCVDFELDNGCAVMIGSEWRTITGMTDAGESVVVHTMGGDKSCASDDLIEIAFYACYVICDKCKSADNYSFACRDVHDDDGFQIGQAVSFRCNDCDHTWIEGE